MIVGLSHITINSIDIEAERSTFLDQGWHEEYFGKNIPSHHSKTSLLNSYQALHSLCILKQSGRNTVELVQHGSEKFATNNIFHVCSDDLIEIRCCKIEESNLFWRNCLGYGGKGDNLVKEAPLREWSSRIKLVETSEIPQSKLDNIGTSCLAYFSTDIERDRSNLEPMCNRITDIMPLQINEKNIRVCMLQAPSYEIIELIEIG